MRLEWRRKNLVTYDLAQRARARCNAIRSALVPEVRYLNLPVLAWEPDPENPTPDELKAAHRRADKKIQIELGGALELVELGDVATLGHLEKRLAIEDRLDAMIARLRSSQCRRPAFQCPLRRYWKRPHSSERFLDRDP